MVGASTGLFGFIGCFIGWLILNWVYLGKKLGEGRTGMVCIMGIFVAMTLMLGFSLG